MDMGVISACLLLLGLCGYFVARPLLTLKNATAGDVSVRQLNERKEQIYASIIELTFDNELDKLPDADFQYRASLDLQRTILGVLEAQVPSVPRSYRSQGPIGPPKGSMDPP